MKKLLLYSFISVSVFALTQTLQAQTAPAKQWDKTFGGYMINKLASVQQTSDGGFILGGESDSPISGDKSQACLGNWDYWIVKLDANGNKQWDKTIGGNNIDRLLSIKQVSDGGYILGGWSNSYISGDKSQNSKGHGDYWIVKIDSNGNKIWDVTIGGNDQEFFSSLYQTTDGGYILGGFSKSGISGDKTQPSKGDWDYWIVKINANGIKIWDKTFGGAGYDRFTSLQQTIDGGYILGGWSASGLSSDKSQASKGGADMWVIKIDSNGNKQWDRTIGGSGNEGIHYLQQTVDGGYVLGGISDSPISGDKMQSSIGLQDFWIVKMASNGNIQWSRTYGSNVEDLLLVLRQTSGGGYIAGGYSSSNMNGDKSENSKGGDDFWILKIDASGMKLWDKTIGGNASDGLTSLALTLDGGYILGGSSSSNISGDKSQPYVGVTDYWVVKLAPDATTGFPEAQTTNLNLYPYPTTGLINLELKDQQPTQISIYNSLGQPILTKTEAQQNPDGKLQLDLSNLAKGIYTIQVISGNQSAVKKVVLQ